MTYESSGEKEKKKGRPGYNIKLWIKAIALAALILLLTPVLVMLLLMIAGRFRSPYLDVQQVVQTCERLSLPADSEFCAKPDQQTTVTLKTTLEHIYPPRLTTIEQLKVAFPAMSCMDEYQSCRVDLPLQWYELYIDYNESGDIQRYSIVHLPL
jgi:hypothetical protein